MEKKNQFSSGRIRYICFILGMLFLIGLYWWRISDIIRDKQEVAGKSVDELIELYFSPSGIYGWDGVSEDISLDTTHSWGELLMQKELPATALKVQRNGKEFRYYGYFSKSGRSENGTDYERLGMRVYVEDAFDKDIKELRVSSYYGEQEIDVGVDFSERSEFYSIKFEDGEYVPNFQMERDIKMSGEEIAALKMESQQVLEQIVYERCYSQQKNLKKITSNTVCFAILLAVWMLIMLPFRFAKKETLPVGEEKVDDYEKIQ